MPPHPFTSSVSFLHLGHVLTSWSRQLWADHFDIYVTGNGFIKNSSILLLTINVEEDVMMLPSMFIVFMCIVLLSVWFELWLCSLFWGRLFLAILFMHIHCTSLIFIVFFHSLQPTTRYVSMSVCLSTHVYFCNILVLVSLLFSLLILLMTHWCAFLCFLCD